MAPLDNLAPPGSSTYNSDTLYVGDGTWDATRNDFLLPNLVGFNYETTRYNGKLLSPAPQHLLISAGMGNRFAGEDQYHDLVRGHGIIAATVFLVTIPAAIMIARFYTGMPGYALKYHIYLQVITVLLITAVIILGFLQVGPARDLSNPHHVIGLTLYVAILLQAFLGRWVHHREKKKPFVKMPLKLYLHQWFGRTIALLGIAQVALGLALYGAPKYLFIMYALWVAFLGVLYFVLSYRRTINYQDIMLSRDARNVATVRTYRGRTREDVVIPDDGEPKSRISNWAPFAAASALWGGAQRKATNRSRYGDPSNLDGGPSRRNSYTMTEKTETTHKTSGVDKAWRAAAVLGMAGLFKGFWDNRKKKAAEEGYSSVDGDTPRKKRPHSRVGSWSESYNYDESEGRTDVNPPAEGPILPGPGDPLMAAEAIRGQERPDAPRPAGTVVSHDSASYTYDSYSDSPSRRIPRREPGFVDRAVGALGLGWFFDRLRQKRQQRQGRIPRDQRTEYTSHLSESSVLSTVLENHNASEVPSAARPTHSRQGSQLARPSAAAEAAAVDLSAAEEGRSRGESSTISTPTRSRQPTTVKVQVHGDKDKKVTLRRLTKQEAAAERSAKRRQRGEATSSISGSDLNSRRGFRREQTLGGSAASSVQGSNIGSAAQGSGINSAGASTVVPGGLGARVKSPPPSFHKKGKQPKDSAYYSDRPEIIGVGTQMGEGSSPSSHGTWSQLSPGSKMIGTGISPKNGMGTPSASAGAYESGAEDAAERRRRRRAERARNSPSGTGGGVEFT